MRRVAIALFATVWVASSVGPARSVAAAPRQTEPGLIECPRFLLRSDERDNETYSDFAPPPSTTVQWADGHLVRMDGFGAWSPDGALAVVNLRYAEPGAGEPWPAVALAAWDGSDPVALDLPGDDPRLEGATATWAPDGEHVAVAAGGATTVVDRTGATTAVLPATGYIWSPSSDRLARPGPDAAVIDVATPPSTVPLGPTGELAWSSDGEWLALTSPAAPTTIRVARADGSEVHDLGDGVLRGGWRPGTHELAWSPAGADPGELSIHDAVAGTSRAVAIGDAITSAQWSPDGSKLAVVSDAQVWVTPALGDGTTATVVSWPPNPTDRSRSVPTLAWSPDGDRVAYGVLRETVDRVRWAEAAMSTADGASIPAPVGLGGFSTTALSGGEWAPDGSGVLFVVSSRSPGDSFGITQRQQVVLGGDLDDPVKQLVAIGRDRGDVVWFPCGAGAVPPTSRVASVPPPPQRPAVDARVVGDAVTLTIHGWNGPPVTEWEVHRDDTDTTTSHPGDVTQVEVPLGAPGTVVTFSVRGVGPVGESPWGWMSLLIPAERIVDGVVRGPDGPVAGASVTLMGTSPWLRTTTAADGSFSFGAVSTGAQHQIQVYGPDSTLVGQWLGGIAMATRASTSFDIELSAADGALAPHTLDVAGEVRRIITTSGESGPEHGGADGGAAIVTSEEIVYLDALGRVTGRQLDVADAFGAASTRFMTTVGRSDSVSSSDGGRILLPGTANGDVAVIGGNDGYDQTAFTMVEAEGALPARLLQVDQWRRRVTTIAFVDGPTRLIGVDDQATTGAGGRLVLWAGGAVRVVDPVQRRLLLDSSGAGFGEDEQVVGATSLGRAWSSDGWSIDLATGERTQVLPTDGSHIALSPERGLLVHDGALVHLDGTPVTALPASGPSAFFAHGAAIAVAGPGGVVHLLPTPTPPPVAPAPTTSSLTAEGVELTWTAGTATGGPIASWEIARDDSDAVVTVPADQLSSVLPAGALGSTVTFSIRAVGPGGTSDWVAFAPVAMPVFTDVGVDHPFRAEIDQAHTDGIVAGYPDGSFRPGLPVSRQAAVTFLWRAADSPTGHPDPGFRDVGADHPFHHAIAWAAAEGITTGYPDGTFRPGAPVTRQAWIAFLWRTDGEPAADPTCTHPGFADVDADHPFNEAITWAACVGITDGDPDGTFRPTATVTRQAATATLVRAG